MADLTGVATADALQLNTSETSAGENAAAVLQPPQPQMSADAARRKWKRRRQEQQQLFVNHATIIGRPLLPPHEPRASKAEQANKMQRFLDFRQEPRVGEANWRGILWIARFQQDGSLPRGFFDGGLLVAVPPPEPALGGRRRHGARISWIRPRAPSTTRRRLP